MHSASRKQQAHALIDKLPDDATYDDMMRELYEHQAIERGSPTATPTASPTIKLSALSTACRNNEGRVGRRGESAPRNSGDTILNWTQRENQD